MSIAGDILERLDVPASKEDVEELTTCLEAFTQEMLEEIVKIDELVPRIHDWEVVGTRPKAGLADQSPSAIAKFLMSKSRTIDQAMDKILFMVNRWGDKEGVQDQVGNLNKALRILQNTLQKKKRTDKKKADKKAKK